MIESIGYTEDGNVWMRLMMMINNEQHSGVMQLTPEAAQWVVDTLSATIPKAKEHVNVRNGENINQVGA